MLCLLEFAAAFLAAILLDGDDSAFDSAVMVIALAAVYPEYCLMVRRIEDLDKPRSEALVLMMISLVFICFDADLYDWVKYLSIGYGGYMLYILLKDGTHGPNQYGEDPLQRIR